MLDELIQVMRTPPLRYQVAGVRFLNRRGGRAIIGDEMGVGKTYQVIAWLQLHPEIRPVVVVCPANVKWSWERQCWEHARMRAVVLNGKRAVSVSGDVVVVNYDVLDAWVPALLKIKPKAVIIDEAHRTKNRRTQRTKACQKLIRGCPHVIGLSGTPIRNRPIEFFPILNMVAPQQFPSFYRYAFRYCGPKKNYWSGGWDFKGASNTEELHERAGQIMLRRTRNEVLEDLPPKRRMVLPVEIDDRKDYERARDDFVEWYIAQFGPKAAMNATALVRLGTLLTMVGWGKRRTIRGWIEEWLDENDGKLVVFTRHRALLAYFRRVFPAGAVLEGATAPDRRKTEVDRFQNDPDCRLFLGNIQAAGEGITLHAASTVLFAELGWTPGEHDQAEDRVLRIGQTASHVDCYYVIGKDTVEEDVIDAIDAKRQVVDQVVDGRIRDDVPMIVLRGLMETTHGQAKKTCGA